MGLSVKSVAQRIVVDDSTKSATIVYSGPPGPRGPVGDGANYYEHTQVNPSVSWVINHNLGYRPNITVEEESSGHEIFCSEIHHSTTQVELQFNTPRAGTARLS